MLPSCAIGNILLPTPEVLELVTFKCFIVRNNWNDGEHQVYSCLFPKEILLKPKCSIC